MADPWANLPYRINDCQTWADCLKLRDEILALRNLDIVNAVWEAYPEGAPSPTIPKGLTDA